ncbi:MAG: aminopeptidase P family protein [Thermoplasmata archaeon]|nr:MAG: aminopeptidase P family protein [Thermoplasmata archaeon]
MEKDLHTRNKCLKKLFPKANFFDVGEAIAKARMIKDKAEIKIIRKACKISAKIAERLSSLFGSNVKECDVKAEIDYMMEKENASPSFDTIVAFGENSSKPHHKSGEKKFAMPVLCDFGASYKNYCSDVTRTFVSKKKQKEVYEIVEEGQFIAFDMMKEGVKAGDVAKCVNNFFMKKGFKKMFHSLGHSIGLSPHDGFSINEKNNEMLKENMILAIEPAIYLKNEWGIRIEDDVLVKKNGIEILTK